jgi:hypothetical protein
MLTLASARRVTGVNIGMNRRYGRIEGGERVNDKRPGNKGKNVTIVGAISDEVLIATMTLPGALNTECFLIYIEKILLLFYQIMLLIGFTIVVSLRSQFNEL